jgi:hypothetical protein
VTAVAKGLPLPAQTLSQEALQCRAARLAADEVRQTKAKAKLAQAKAAKAAPKKPVTLSSNSVAARRLATMRGLPVPEMGGLSVVNDGHHEEEEEEHDGNQEGFDPFATHSAPAHTTMVGSAPRPSFTADAGSFDPFGTAATAVAPRASFGSAPASSAGFASFGDNADAFAAPASASGFDAFGSELAAPVVEADGFGSVADSSFAASAFSNFDDAANTPVSSTFDAFAPDSAFEPSPSSGGEGKLFRRFCYHCQ